MSTRDPSLTRPGRVIFAAVLFAASVAAALASGGPVRRRVGNHALGHEAPDHLEPAAGGQAVDVYFDPSRPDRQRSIVMSW